MNRSENTFNLNVYLVELKIIRKELTDFYVVLFSGVQQIIQQLLRRQPLVGGF